MNTTFQTRYQKLNPEQQQAVDTIEGPVLVVAGPGAGKTELLALRIANILLKTDAIPSEILCLTFTEAAASNMRRRLLGLIGKEAYKVAIHTFHSFGQEVISQNPEFFYRGAVFTPADQLTQIQILEEIFQKLPHSDPLASHHHNQGFTYLRETLTRIHDLKQAGISPQEFKDKLKNSEDFLKQANPIITELFQERISAKNLHLFHQALKELKQTQESDLKEHITASLKEALSQTEAGSKPSTKPITAWKKDYTQKDHEKNTILKDHKRLEPLKSLASIYQQYQETLHNKAYFDFADMLLDTLSALQNNPELRFNLQESYQYLLVDEFQDTSGVQLRLIDQILDSNINEGRPNILAVGDDDQSIYKFQGASLDNILTFHKKYRDPQIITLTKNYRSHQNLLDYFRPIIQKGEGRLEDMLPEVNKELTAGNPNIQTGQIHQNTYETDLEELTAIAHEIKALNLPLNEVAIIARKHSQLENVAKVFKHYDIPVHYERKENLLEKEHIKQLVTLLRFIADPNEQSTLPEILSFPYWQLDRLTMWKVSVNAHKTRKPWLEIMLLNEQTKPIAEHLIDLSQQALTHTAEEMIDLLTEGAYRAHHFNELDAEYLNKLKALHSFIQVIRKHQQSEPFTVKELLNFIDLHHTHNLPLTYTLGLKSNEQAVSLLTAHGSKGLEFDCVFVINAQDQIWHSRAVPTKINFTTNLKISAEKETTTDKLRLFYVALTRARKHLYITAHNISQQGREFTPLRFLEQPEENIIHNVDTDQNLTLLSLEILKPLPLNIQEQTLLKNLVEDYQLSVTHFNNFLNLVYHGPQEFLKNQLLRFPQMMGPAAAYGSAVHNALHRFQIKLKKDNTLPQLDHLLNEFTDSLKKQRLNQNDLTKYQQKGLDQLTEFYEQRKTYFTAQDLAEFDFRDQGVILNSAKLTGKIDRITLDSQNHQATVIDYKTGKPLTDWQGKTESQILKAWAYKNQLIFYKLLLENARSFKNKYTVTQGSLEFVEPYHQEIKTLDLTFTPEEVAQTKKLIDIVYNKIINLDFPDTSAYEPSPFGIEHFTLDLLEGRI